jgi:hypothetical protein
MRFAILSETDRSLSDVAHRLFELGEADGDTVQAVEEDLLRENPFLRENTQFPAGALLIIPETSKVRLREKSEVTEDSTTALALMVQVTLRVLDVALKEAVENEKTEYEQLRKVADSREMQEAVKEDSDAQESLKRTAELAEIRLKAVTSELSAHTVALGELGQAFKPFLMR